MIHIYGLDNALTRNGESHITKTIDDLGNFIYSGSFFLDTWKSRPKVFILTNRGGIDWDYLLRAQIRIKGRYILERFDDPGSIAGGDKTHHLFALEIRCRF